MAIDGRLLEEELAGLDALDLDEDHPNDRLARLWSALWPKLAAVFLALAAWQVTVWSQWRPEYVLPSPGRVLAELGNLLGEGEFYRAIAITMRRALVGYALAVLVGTVAGASVARVRPLRTAVGSLITGLQTMPSIAWFPLAILLFQLSESAILFVVVLGAAPSIANGLIAGVDHVPPLLLRAGRVLGASGLRLYRHVILPASLPSFVAGLKQGWAFAWRSLMAGELLVILANRPSIGARLQFARELSDAPALLALMIVVLVIGIVVDGVFNQVDGHIRARRGLTAGA
ncbi:MAG: ABC transporter permease [Actinomycetota bacterium]|nr:ABC transporter permease [Actinomycetota bacterium]